MKQGGKLFLILILVCALCACELKQTDFENISIPVQNFNTSEVSESLLTDAQSVSKDTQTSPMNTDKADVDIDLTMLSSTMVYAEVYNMMVSPSEYIGKSVKMNGQVALYQGVDETGAQIEGQICFACIITDAAACCSQGIEFVLADNASYPELGSQITVTGRFQTYEKNGYVSCHLVDATFVN